MSWESLATSSFLLCCAGEAGFFQFRTHNIEAFGERAEEVAPVHFEGYIEVSARDPLGKAFQLFKWLDYAAVYIKSVQYACAALRCGGNRENYYCRAFLHPQGLRAVVEYDYFADRFAVLDDVEYSVAVRDCFV